MATKKKLIEWMHGNRLTIAGVLAGAVAGWCYWYFVGCSSGTCPITSKPLNSAAYGAFMGAIAFSIFKKDELKKKSEI